MALTLYYSPGACSLAVHIVLEWIGADYSAVTVNTSDPFYLEINPAGAVPALDYGGDQSLTQCGAILQYLADRFPTSKLAEAPSNEARAEISRWSSFLTGDLHPAFFPIFMPQRYTIDTTEHALFEVKKAGIILVLKKLGIVEQHLKGRDWFVGDQRSIIDAYSVPMIRWASSLLETGLKSFPSIHSHHQRMLSDPAVRKTMVAEGLIKT